MLIFITTYPILFSTLTTYPFCPAFHACIHDNNLSNIFSPQQPLTHPALNFVFVSMTTYPLLFFHRNHLPILPCILCLYPCQQLTQYPPPQQPLTHLALHFVLVSSQLVQLFFGKVGMWDRHVNTQSLDARTTKVMCDHDVGVICVHNSLVLKQ